MIAKTSLVRLRETNSKTQSIFKTILIKAKEIQTHRLLMLRIKEDVKISLRGKDFLIMKEREKMQRHQMELKVNATHQGRTFQETATT